MTTLKNTLVRLAKDEDGAAAVEYALLVSLIAVVIVGAVRALGGAANAKLQEAKAGISGN